MKLIKNLAILVGAFTLCSCSELTDLFRKDSISVSPVSASANAASQDLVFDIVPSEAWTVDHSGHWLVITPTSGDKETTQVKVNISANTDKESRTDTLIFTCGKLFLKVPVTQDGIGSIFSTTDIVLEETAKFTMEAYSSWEIATTDTKAAPSWFEVSPLSGEKGQVEITVKSLQDNVYQNDRNAFIKVKMGGGTPFYLTVTQKHVNAILDAKDKFEVPMEGGVFSLPIRANMTYSLTFPNQFSWVSKAQKPATKAAVTTTEYFKVDANGNYNSREAYILVNGEIVTDTVYIFQAQKDVLILGQDTLRFNNAASAKTVDLRGNIEYSSSIIQSGEWVRIVSPQAYRTDQINLRVDENTTSSTREAQVIFKDINSTLSDTLYVIQKSASTLTYLNETAYGIYRDFGDGECIVYTKYKDQYAFSSGSLRVQNFRDSHYMAFTGIPATVTQGDSFSMRVLQNYSNSFSSDTTLTVNAVKVTSDLIWLSNAQKELGFIIKK